MVNEKVMGDNPLIRRSHLRTPLNLNNESGSSLVVCVNSSTVETHDKGGANVAAELQDKVRSTPQRGVVCVGGGCGEAENLWQYSNQTKHPQALQTPTLTHSSFLLFTFLINGTAD